MNQSFALFAGIAPLCDNMTRARFLSQARGGRSVFRCQHDGENSHGLRGVGGIFAAVFHIGRVVINFPKDAPTVVLERTEVALAMWVVIGGKIVEGFHLLSNRRLLGGGLGANAVRL